MPEGCGGRRAAGEEVPGSWGWTWGWEEPGSHRQRMPREKLVQGPQQPCSPFSLGGLRGALPEAQGAGVGEWRVTLKRLKGKTGGGMEGGPMGQVGLVRGPRPARRDKRDGGRQEGPQNSVSCPRLCGPPSSDFCSFQAALADTGIPAGPVLSLGDSGSSPEPSQPQCPHQ